MTSKEAKSLKWGDRIVPSDQHRKTFTTGKRITEGIFLGLKKDKSGLLKIVTKGASTVYSYHRHYWEVVPKPTRDSKGRFTNESA